MRLTVIPCDCFMCIDGRALWFDYQTHDSFRAIQWFDVEGEVEYSDGRPNCRLEYEDYTSVIKPYVQAFETEAARLDACPGDFYVWDAAAGVWVFDEASANHAYRREIEMTRPLIEAREKPAIRAALLAVAKGRPIPPEAVAALEDVETDTALLESELERVESA